MQTGHLGRHIKQKKMVCIRHKYFQGDQSGNHLKRSAFKQGCKFFYSDLIGNLDDLGFRLKHLLREWMPELISLLQAAFRAAGSAPPEGPCTPMAVSSPACGSPV
ncbi:hypothetical protein [Prosthecobacter sp. SYSU 5D2]|uniref:hypothetical protein n=1 Tax=Prosthecobacter sp. SYSU 5D2 TaxID=3134134 RepID=UPI0031FE47C7